MVLFQSTLCPGKNILHIFCHGGPQYLSHFKDFWQEFADYLGHSALEQRAQNLEMQGAKARFAKF